MTQMRLMGIRIANRFLTLFVSFILSEWSTTTQNPGDLFRERIKVGGGASKGLHLNSKLLCSAMLSVWHPPIRSPIWFLGRQRCGTMQIDQLARRSAATGVNDGT